MAPPNDTPAQWKRPQDVARWAGLMPISEGADLPPVPPLVAIALADLDQIAREGCWRDPRVLWLHVDKGLSFALGLGFRDPATRFRAVVVRAYIEAIAVETAHKRRMDDQLRAPEIASEFREIRDRLLRAADLPADIFEDDEIDHRNNATHNEITKCLFDPREADDDDLDLVDEAYQSGLLCEANGILEQNYFDSPDTTKTGQEMNAAVLRALNDYIRKLQDVGNLRKARGRHSELGRDFLVYRLAELFTISSGRMPERRGARFIRGVDPATDWHRFLSAALRILGWESLGWVDNALRKVVPKGLSSAVAAELTGEEVVELSDEDPSDEESAESGNSGVPADKENWSRFSLASSGAFRRYANLTNGNQFLRYGELKSMGILIDLRLPTDGSLGQVRRLRHWAEVA